MENVTFDCDERNYERLKKLADERGVDPMQIIVEKVRETLARMDKDTREKWREIARGVLRRAEERDRKDGGVLNV